MKRLLPALLVVCLLQWTVPLGLIWQHQATLRTGTVYRFRTAPVDPVDPFRGRYVQLRFEAAQLPSSPLAWPEDGSPLFAPVTTDADGDARLGTPVPQPPEQGDWLPVRLHLLVPAVENAINSNSFRPGDVLRSRKGLSVEIGNTDAEGRLILGDALQRASEEKPELILDFATLTGAARVALGPDYPALMTRRDETADALIAAGKAHDDEPWRLPLPDGYREWLNSDIADTNNAHGNAFAGASVAGLFLDKFVGDGIDWAHFDTFAWRPQAKPGRPKGGDAYGLRAAWHMLKGRFGGA